MLVAHDSVLLVVLLHLHADLVNEVGDLVDGEFLHGVVEHIVELDEHGGQVPLLGVGDPEGLFLGELGDLLAGEAGLSDDGAHPDVGVDEVDGSVALRVQHLLEGEDVVRYSVLLQVVVLDRGDAQLLRSVLVLLRLQGGEDLLSLLLVAEDYVHLFVLLLSALELVEGVVPGLIEQVEQFDVLSCPGLELLAVLAEDDSEAHVLASLVGQPAGLLGSGYHHLEVLSLARVSDVDDPISLHLQESVVDGGEVSAVVVVASVGLHDDERDLVLFDEDALGLSALRARQVLEDFLLLLLVLLCLLLLLLLALLLALLLGLALDALLGGGGVLLDESLGRQLLDDGGDHLVVVALPVLLDVDVESLVDGLEVLPRHVADHFPGLYAGRVVCLQLHHRLLRDLLEDRIRVELCPCGLVVGVEVFDVGELSFVIGIGLLHVGDEHAELRAPVPNVVGPSDVVAHELEHSADRLPDDGAPEVAHVHLLGDVGRGEINDHCLLLDLGVGEVVDELVDLLLDELILDLDLQEALLVGLHHADVVVLVEPLGGLPGELHDGLAAEGCPLLLVPVDVELLHGGGRDVLAFSLGPVLQQDVRLDSEGFVEENREGLLDQRGDELTLNFLHIQSMISRFHTINIR